MRQAMTRSGRAWAVFLMATWAFLMSQFFRVSVSVVSPDLVRDLGIRVSDLGGVSAAFFYAFAACQIPAGLALDRWGPRLVMAAASAVAVAGAVLFALAGGVVQAVWGRALLGVGMSCNFMGGLTLLGAWFPPQRFATMSGLMASLAALGLVMAATPLALFSEWTSWRWAFLASALVNAVQGALLFLLVRDRPEGSDLPRLTHAAPLSHLLRIAAMPAYWCISLGTFFRYGCFAALQGLWAGPFLAYGLGMDAVGAGNALVCLSLGYIVALPLAGRLSDHVLRSRKYVIMPALLVLALAMLGLGAVGRGAPWWLVGGLFFFLAAASAPGQVMYAHIREISPPHMAATAMTAINQFTMLGVAVMMQAGGLVVPGDPAALDSPAAFMPVWLLFGGCLAGAGALYLLTPDSAVLGEQPGWIRRLNSRSGRSGRRGREGGEA